MKKIAIFAAILTVTAVAGTAGFYYAYIQGVQREVQEADLKMRVVALEYRLKLLATHNQPTNAVKAVNG